jgi:hypothetical protein
MSTIHEKLVAIQSELKAPKSQVNKHFGYKYRSCEDMVEAIKPLTQKHNCVVLLSDDVVEVCGRPYVKATASITDGESSIVCTGWAAEPTQSNRMDASQCTGSASTYARKRALDGLFAIDDTKDSDATNDGKTLQKPVTAPPAKPVTPAKPTTTKVMESITESTTKEQVEKLWARVHQFAWTEEEMNLLRSCYTNTLARL